MKYRNKKTGSAIEIRSKLSGKDWEEIKEIKETPSAKARKRRTKEAAE